MIRREEMSQADGGQALLERMRSAVRAQRDGRLDQAIEQYRSVLRLHPRFPEAHNNLAVALKARGRLTEAIESFRRALEARPDYAAAHANLASTLNLADHRMDALRHAVSAVRLDPDNPGHKRILADSLRSLRLTSASPEVAWAITACFESEGIEHQLISAAAVSLLRQDPAVGEALKIAEKGDRTALTRSLQQGKLHGLFENPLLHGVLSKSLVAAPDFECLLALLRDCCLKALQRSEGGTSPPAGLFHPDPSLILALAQQCFLNGYLYPRAEEQDRALQDFQSKMGLPSPHPAALCVLAMFQPLHRIKAVGAPVDWGPYQDGPYQALVRQQMTEPESEERLERDLPSLTPVADPVSQAVRRQYEANPYPRWISTNYKEARPLSEVVAGLFPRVSGFPSPGEPLRVLVAGCGTGKHAVDVALRYRDAEILAVDLSRASLAYAQRKAQELGLRQIRFAQADILTLESLDQRFDLIESVGVLHHLEDPFEGWRQLRRLLRGRGLMKIGLYSAKARRTIEAGRTFLRDRGFTPDQDDIRRSRQAIFGLPADHPAFGVSGELDFYSLSGCRDLLFNVQESALSIPEIERWLEALELAFLGFELVERATLKAYKDRFPQDPGLADLQLWDRFETERPDTFRTMYQFWCQSA